MRPRTLFPPVLLLVMACTSVPPSVAVSGSARDLERLSGRWSGEYSSRDTGRSGSIVFTLSPDGAEARGDVLMIPGDKQPATGGRAPDQRWLKIRFVGVAGNTVTGTIAPYADADCGCTLTTVFTGEVIGSTISGTFESTGDRPRVTQRGRWKVTRD